MNAFGSEKKNVQFPKQKIENSDDKVCNYRKITLYIVLISVIIVVITAIITSWLCLPGKTEKAEDDFYVDNFSVLADIKNKLKLHLIALPDSEYQLNSDDEATISKPLEQKFPDLKNDNQLQKICVLGIKVLYACIQDSPGKKYYKISGEIVSLVLKVVMNYKLDEKIVERNMELFTVDLPHLLAIYELIARINNNNLNIERSETINELIKQCHKYIDGIVDFNLESKYNKASEKKNDFINRSAPYFFTTYLQCDKKGNELYRKAVIGDNIRRLHRYLLHEESSRVARQYGVLREDGGAVLDDKIANYSMYIELIESIKYPDFYAAVYDSLDLPGNLHKSAQVVLDKLLHRDVPNLPFGLFRLDGDVSKKNHYWNLGSPKNITLLPSMSAGIYKTDKFMFSLRVQRKNTPICRINSLSDNCYAIGAIQLRTIYLAGHKNYGDIDLNNWDNLKYQPSIITVGENWDCLPLKVNATTKNLYSPTVKGYNYIGQIPEDDVMFWKNDYILNLTDFNELRVLECGIACQNGLSIVYEIETLYPDTDKYQFHYDIITNHNKQYFKYTIIPTGTTGPLNVDSYREYIYFGSNKITFKWNVDVANFPADVNLTYNSSSEEQQFTPGRFRYKVKVENNDYYVVQRDNKDYLLGSMSDKKDHTIKHKGRVYKRDEKTFMYPIDN